MNIHQQIINIITAIEPKVYWFLIQLCIGFFIVLIIKSIISTAVSYLFFRINPYMCVGTDVILDNKYNGRIKSVSTWTISIETTDGFLNIPMLSWSKRDWLILKGKRRFKHNFKEEK